MRQAPLAAKKERLVSRRRSHPLVVRGIFGGMKVWFRTRFSAAMLAAVSLIAGCGETTPKSEPTASPSQPAMQPVSTKNSDGKPLFDLEANEKRGGHVLARHVGKTDEELRRRLQAEPNLTVASTYPDRKTAEEAIAAALKQREEKVRGWLKKRRKRDLMLDYYATTSVGRSLRRGETQSFPCTRAVVVLRWAGADYYVLESYPECR